MGIKQRAKAVWARFSRTQFWRAWKRYGDRRGNRLAGATSFFGFLSMFPLIVLAAAVTGRLLNDSAVNDLKDALKKNLPGIGNQIDLDSLINNAGTIGLIATGASSILTGLSKKIADWTGLEGTWFANWGLDLISLVVGIGAGAVLFLYLQTALPRIILPRKVALIAALAGGIVFYLAQKLGNSYVKNVIGNNAAYGTLALPLALLVWIYLMTRVIMLIAAWTKEATLDYRSHTGEAARAATPFERESSVPADDDGYLPGPPGKKFKVVPIPERKADTVAVAAGAVLGATATALAVQLVRAARSLRR